LNVDGYIIVNNTTWTLNWHTGLWESTYREWCPLHPESGGGWRYVEAIW